MYGCGHMPPAVDVGRAPTPHPAPMNVPLHQSRASDATGMSKDNGQASSSLSPSGWAPLCPLRGGPQKLRGIQRGGQESFRKIWLPVLGRDPSSRSWVKAPSSWSLSTVPPPWVTSPRASPGMVCSYGDAGSWHVPGIQPPKAWGKERVKKKEALKHPSPV